MSLERFFWQVCAYFAFFILELGDATSLESSGGFNVNNMPSSHLRPGDRVYATSVPVGIPLFENRAHSYEPESDPEEVSRSTVGRQRRK